MEEEFEIDNKLKALERELDEMKRRTNNLLANESLPPPPVYHAELVSNLVSRTTPPATYRQTQILDVGYGTQAALRKADTHKYTMPSDDSPLTRLELEQAERRVAELSQQTDIERSFSTAERTKRERLEVECIDIKRKLVDQDKELLISKASTERELIDLRSQLRQSSINLQSAEDALTTSKSELSRENSQRRQLETQLSVMTTQRMDLEKRTAFLEQTIRDLHSTVDDLSHKSTNLSEENGSLERKLRQQIVNADALGDADKMRQEAETSALKLRSQLVELQRLRKEDATEIQRLMGENELARSEINKLTDETYRVGAELEKTRNQLLNSTSENKQLKIITDKQKSELRRIADQVTSLQHDNRALIKAQHDSLIAAVSADLQPNYSPTYERLTPPESPLPEPVPTRARQPQPTPWASHETQRSSEGISVFPLLHRNFRIYFHEIT